MVPCKLVKVERHEGNVFPFVRCLLHSERFHLDASYHRIRRPRHHRHHCLLNREGNTSLGISLSMLKSVTLLMHPFMSWLFVVRMSTPPVFRSTAISRR
jgi:hypothetical protein